jgi:hypothetical protein
MDAEPKALRLSILLTIAFVLFGVIAGSFLFVLGKDRERTGGTLAGAELDAIETRAMEPSPRVDPKTRARLAELATLAVESPMPEVRRAAGAELLDLGVLAVPTLLDVIHRAVTGERGLAVPEAKLRLRSADSILTRIRLTLMPTSPADPMPIDPNTTWLLRRGKSWFAWWDDYVAQHPEAK